MRWLQNYPHFLETVYDAAHQIVFWLKPLIERLGFERTDRLIRWGEEVSKRAVFDCRMCGQCVLHSTGMTCSMSCPKNLRNGPCGGVRADGHCEVFPDKQCVWVEAFERSRHMPTYGHEMLQIQPPVNRQLEGTSAWVNMLTGVDKVVPVGWVGTANIPVMAPGSETPYAAQLAALKQQESYGD